MNHFFQVTLPTGCMPSRFRLFFGILLVFALAFCFSPTPALSADLTLAWDPNTEEDLAGYRIYYRTADGDTDSDGDYDFIVDVGNQTECTVTDHLELEEGLPYYFSATAYDLAGNESDYSNEVPYTPRCNYSITPTSQSFDYSGGTGVVNVTAKPRCSWAAVSNAAWLIITSNSNGLGNGTIYYTVSQNSENSGRTGTLTIEDRTLTVTQQEIPTYSLTVTTAGTGTGTVTTNPSGTLFNAGTVVTLTAAPDVGSTFTGWSGGVSGTSPTLSFTMNTDTTVTAGFTLKTYTITATAGPNGSISPQGSVTANHGANQSFTITPNEHYRVADLKVDGLSQGALTTYTFMGVISDHTIQAGFTPIIYTLTLTTAGTGTGTVTTNPSGTLFNAGTVVALTAAPDVSSTFTGWSGGVSGTSPTVSLTMNRDTTVTATFTLRTYTITAAAGNHGSISPNGPVVVNHGASQQFTITPDPVYGIAEVKVDGVSIGAVGSYSFSNVATNHTIEASFVSLLPEAATLVSPSAKTYANTPTYVWNAVSNSTQYYVKVNDAGGTKIQQWVTASEAGCSNGTGTCSVTPPAELAAGAGTWWIQTRNSFGDGPLSQGLAFTVSKPEAATPVSPTGKIKDRTPLYTWDAVEGSTKYYLMVNDSTGAKIRKWYTAAEVGCPSGTGTCSATPSIELAIGTVKWWIQTWSPVGTGPWSDSIFFTLSR